MLSWPCISVSFPADRKKYSGLLKRRPCGSVKGSLEELSGLGGGGSYCDITVLLQSCFCFFFTLSALFMLRSKRQTGSNVGSSFFMKKDSKGFHCVVKKKKGFKSVHTISSI